MKRLLLVTVAALALAGCGARKGLVPPEGGQLPVAPYGAAAIPSADALLQPAPQARPARSDDLIESTNRRRSDEFDLPPPN
jgi:hypothetical protein